MEEQRSIEILNELKVIKRALLYNLLLSNDMFEKSIAEKAVILDTIGIKNRNEIAEMLNTTPGTIRVALSRAKK